MLCMISICSFAATASKEKQDTIGINQNDISRWIEEPYVTNKGEEKMHYYAIYKGNLITVSKSVVEKVKLCSKYGAKCALAIVGSRKDGVFKPKRIIIN